MKPKFAKTRRESVYRLTYDDTIGKREEKLLYKNPILKELVDPLRQNGRAYRAAVNEQLFT